MLLITMVLASLTWSNTVPGEFDWVIADTEFSEATDAIGYATGEVDPLNENANANVTARTNPSDWHTMTHIYEWEDRRMESILTPENLKTMCETEAVLATHENYPKICLLTKDVDNPRCTNMTMSFPLKFYGEGHDWTCPLLSSDEIVDTTETLINSLSTPLGMLMYGIHFDKGTVGRGYPVMVRSFVNFGAPLEGFTSEDDRINEQNGEFEKLVKPWEAEINDEYFKKPAPGFGGSVYMTPSVKNGLQVTYWGFDTQQLEFVRLVESDMLWSTFALLFVYIWMSVHTGSCILSSVGMLQIVCSLPIGCGIYKLLFGIPYFDTLQTLVIFLVLGVGADDVFVLADAWKQSEKTVSKADYMNEVDYIHDRLFLAYSRTAQAVFNTSFTTAMAFVATAMSPIMPISTFGVYAAICIILNYLMVITVTPAAVVMVYKNMGCCFGVFCKKVPDDWSNGGAAIVKKEEMVSKDSVARRTCM